MNKQVTEWSKKETNLVVQSNELIESHFKSSVLERKIFLNLIMQIQPTDEEFKSYIVKANDIGDYLNVSRENVYREFSSAVHSLLSRVYEVPCKGSNEFDKITLMARARYNNGTLELQINPMLKSHLLQLRNNFTQYEVGNINKLKNFCSIRLYENLKRYLGLGQIDLKLDKLKGFLGIQDDEYKKFSDFNRYIIAKSVKEINEKTDILVEYENIKSGRSVTSIKFTMREKDTPHTENQLSELGNIWGFDLEEFKIKTKLDDVPLNSNQVIELIDTAVEHLESLARLRDDLTGDQIIEYIMGNVEYSKQKKNVKNFYAYLKTAIEKDYSKTALKMIIEKMEKELSQRGEG